MKYELPDRLKEKPEYADLNQSGTTPAAFIQNVASPDADKTHQFAWAPSEKEIARAKNPDASPEAWASLLAAEELSSGDLTTEQRATNVAAINQSVDHTQTRLENRKRRQVNAQAEQEHRQSGLSRIGRALVSAAVSPTGALVGGTVGSAAGPGGTLMGGIAGASLAKGLHSADQFRQENGLANVAKGMERKNFEDDPIRAPLTLKQANEVQKQTAMAGVGAATGGIADATSGAIETAAGLQESTADGLAKLAEVAENRAAKNAVDKAHGDETEGWFNGVMGTGMNWMTGLMGMGLDSAVDTQGAAETGTDTVVATLNGAVDDALPSGAAEPSAASTSDEGKRFTIQQIAEMKGSEWKKKRS